MGKRMKTLAIILSMLMGVQTPAMAGELVAEDVPVQEELAVEDIAIEEEIPEEVTIEGQIPEEATIEEQIPEAVEEEVIPEDEISDGELLEEMIEDSLIPEDTFEEELVEEPIETVTEEVSAEQIDIVPSEEEGIIEEDEPALVGESSGQCGDNVYWSLTDDGTLTISGTGAMWDAEYLAGPPWVNLNIIAVIIESGVSRIGNYAFRTSYLTSVMIPDSVTSIGLQAFYSCSSLKSVTIPDSVTSIDGGAFAYCTSLTHVAISNSLTSIGEGAFGNCSSLMSVTIPDSVTSIGNEAFYDCSSLASVTIPDSVTSIGYGAFSGCTSLTGISVSANNSAYLSDEGILFNKDQSVLICAPGRKAGAYVIPAGVTSIGKYAFDKCSSLTSVMIPDSVKSIGEYAFYYCNSLTSVKIPNGVTSIDDWTFYGCSSLMSTTIPDSVKNIGSHAFTDCSSLTSVTIPEGVPSIGAYAFYGCSALTGVTLPASVKLIGQSAFFGCESLDTITFEGNVPEFRPSFYNAAYLTVNFGNVNATAYYPAGNSTWTEDVRQNYGGTITWKPSGLLDGKVTANNFVKNASTTAQTFSIGATRLGTGKLTYSINSEYVTVDDKGNVTIPAYYVGKPTITITAAATDTYAEASKKILVTINRIAGKITANNITLNASASNAQTKNIVIKSQLGKGKLTYSSNSSSVKVDSTGKVTIAKNYVGTATIKINAAASGIYNAASTSIKVTVNKIEGKITASNFIKNAFPYEKYFYIGARRLGTGKMTYKSNSGAVTVDSSGKVTIPRNYAGIVTIRIYADASGIYKSAFKKITVTIRPQVPTISSAVNSAAGKMTAKWARYWSATGYVLQYATNNTFTAGVKNVWISQNSTRSKVIGGLTKGKTYYVRLRTFRTIGNTTLYSGWSGTKTVKIVK